MRAYQKTGFAAGWALALGALGALGGCESWDWRETGRAAVQSACTGSQKCDYYCAPGDAPVNPAGRCFTAVYPNWPVQSPHSEAELARSKARLSPRSSREKEPNPDLSPGEAESAERER